jgi:hypothetical protein
MDERRYLYHARINRHLTLEQIGLRTALSPTVLRDLDEGRFERLPSGLYARSYVRAFAAAVGLDPTDTLAHVEHLLPGAPDPVPVLNAKDPSPGELASKTAGRLCERARTVVRSIRTEVIEKASSLQDVLRTEVRQAQWSLRATTGLSPDLPALTASSTERFVGPRAALRPRSASADRVRAAGEDGRRAALARYGAALVDAIVLLVVEISLVVLVSQSSGIPLERLLQEAGLALAAFCAVPLLLYFLLFGGIGGSTLGRYVCSVRRTAERAGGDRLNEQLTLVAILKRAVD